ncbi:MAG: YbaN family protein [Zhaonellaceae bacterium]|jgi:uncharacterized membrane protein YbaN (DUF454 family)|nr:DUF454 domain-containing protein [Clostridia bacterium]
MVIRASLNILLIILGTISLVFGLIGIFLPVLPTTPFLLLSSFCYLRSSKRLYRWLINHKVFGSYIYNYLTFRAVKRSTKIAALLTLWLSLGVSSFLIKKVQLIVLICLIGTIVSIHLIRLRTLENIQRDVLKKPCRAK